MFVPKSVVCLRDYSWKQFHADAGAGLVVGLVAIPLAMAFSIACGLPPERGLYTAVVAGFLLSALSGSRVTIGGPTGAFIVIVAGVVTRYGYEGLALATAMAGIILIVLGLSRLGGFVKSIPPAVVTGFTAGIAVVIFSTQIKDWLGLPINSLPADFLSRWVACMKSIPNLNPYALGIGLFTSVCLLVWPRGWKVPGSLMALVAASLAAGVGQFPVETIGSRFGGIPGGFPPFHWLALTGAQALQLLPSAFLIAALGAIESLLCAVVADHLIDGHHKSNLELVAQGLSNTASALFGGIPSTGAIARTATNVRNGGRTPVAGMIHALVVLLVLLAAGPLAARVPLAVLAGILVVVCFHMFEWETVWKELKGSRVNALVLLTTLLLTLFVNLTVAVASGCALAALIAWVKKLVR